MKLGIMQPYFLPYIGYWQLLNAVDKYVIYDDVNYIKGGWINRNRILNNGKVQYINVQMFGASSFKHINEIGVNCSRTLVEKSKKTLYAAYHKSSYFEIVYPIICKILECDKVNLAEYLEFSIKIICEYLCINTELYVSSQIKKNEVLSGEDKVIDICKHMGADTYYNAIGGKKLYHFDKFMKNGIKLCFLDTDEIRYQQQIEGFEANLSIVDVMMHNSVEEIRQMLSRYTLVEND